MAISKKRGSTANKPEDKNAVAEAKYEGAAATSVKKVTANDTKKMEGKPRAFVSRRVWPD